MQPYFFPYLGYFALIYHTDQWVVFDSSQYTPKSWINRNRVLNLHKDWSYISIPIEKSSQSKRINEIKVKSATSSRNRIINQILEYKNKAPYFPQVLNLIENIFQEFNTSSLVDLNTISIKYTCEYLGIPYRDIIFSQSGLVLPEINHPGSWALEIASALGATHYLNPVGGKSLFKDTEFNQRGIKLEFLETHKYSYSTYPFKFADDLSVIDVMMWNSAEEIRSILNNFSIVSS
jgi:hypothetical protein